MDMEDLPIPRGQFDARYLAFLETAADLRPKLHRYCARMVGSTLDGEDVAQDALFDAYRRLDTYDDRRPLGPWLFRIAHNRCIDLLRRRRRACRRRTRRRNRRSPPPSTLRVRRSIARWSIWSAAAAEANARASC